MENRAQSVRKAGRDTRMGPPRLCLLSPSKGDFVDPCLGDLILVLKLPSWLKGLLAFLLKPLVRAQRVRGTRGQGRLWGPPS